MIKTTGLNKQAGRQVDSVLKNSSTEVLSMIPQTESLKRGLRRYRAKGETIERLPQPDNMDSWVIPERLRYFLLFDSKATYGDHRFMVFSTNEDLKNYSQCEESFSDGTWDTPCITNSPKTEKTQVSKIYIHT